MVTADTITNAQLDRLMYDADQAGDSDMVHLCMVALDDAVNEHGDFEPSSPDEQRFAKQRCAEVINLSASAADLTVSGGATGIRTSEITGHVRIGTLKVSGAGSVGIDLDLDDKEIK